jgi:hypothetical protein
MTVIIKKVEGHIKPLDTTRLRKDYSTYSDTIQSYAKGSVVVINQIIERIETTPGSPHDYKGDMWGKVIEINGVKTDGYMAIMYHDTKTFVPLRICSEHYALVENRETVFPDFILATGSKEDGSYVEIKYVPEE